MNVVKTMLAASLMVATGVAQAELSANIGVQSNYYFRGLTQTDDGPAVSGGIDYSDDSGFYAGGWMSNVDFPAAPRTDVEVNLYSGFAGVLRNTGVGYDLNARYYYYPGAGGDVQGGELDYAEAGGSLNYGPAILTIAYTFWAEADDLAATAQSFQDGDLWYELAVIPDWSYEGFSPSATIGYAAFEEDGDGGQKLDYATWTVSVTKDAGDFGSFSVNYVQTDDDDSLSTDDDPNFWLGWSRNF